MSLDLSEHSKDLNKRIFGAIVQYLTDLEAEISLLKTENTFLRNTSKLSPEPLTKVAANAFGTSPTKVKTPKPIIMRNKIEGKIFQDIVEKRKVKTPKRDKSGRFIGKKK